MRWWGRAARPPMGRGPGRASAGAAPAGGRPDTGASRTRCPSSVRRSAPSRITENTSSANARDATGSSVPEYRATAACQSAGSALGRSW
ncbi:hypothetical protein ACFQ0B_31765 [Nonomuraea thailandensis]